MSDHLRRLSKSTCKSQAYPLSHPQCCCCRSFSGIISANGWSFASCASTVAAASFALGALSVAAGSGISANGWSFASSGQTANGWCTRWRHHPWLVRITANGWWPRACVYCFCGNGERHKRPNAASACIYKLDKPNYYTPTQKHAACHLANSRNTANTNSHQASDNAA